MLLAVLTVELQFSLGVVSTHCIMSAGVSCELYDSRTPVQFGRGLNPLHMSAGVWHAVWNKMMEGYDVTF